MEKAYILVGERSIQKSDFGRKRYNNCYIKERDGEGDKERRDKWVAGRFRKHFTKEMAIKWKSEEQPESGLLENAGSLGDSRKA